MKRFPFLLLDAGPIIKLFELDMWDDFIKKCDVTISEIVACQAERVGAELGICIDLGPYKKQRFIKTLDVEWSIVKSFYDKFDPVYQPDIHDGEKETLAFLNSSSENWLVCAGDHVVFKILGLLGKAEQGISLEEVLTDIGLGSVVNWQKITPEDREYWPYTRKFREKWTRKGLVDFIQRQGLL